MKMNFLTLAVNQFHEPIYKFVSRGNIKRFGRLHTVKLVLLNIYQPVMQSCHNRTSTVATLTKAIITSGNINEIFEEAFCS